MARNVDERQFIMLKDLAQRLGRHPTTVLHWYQTGKVDVDGFKNYRGWWMFLRKDIAKFEAYQSKADKVQ